MNAGPGRPSGGGGRSRRRRGRRPNNHAAPAPAAPASHARIRTASIPRPWTTAIARRWRTATTARRASGAAPRLCRAFCASRARAAARAREDANSRIFAFVDDLFFAAKIQETARKLNVKVEFAKNDKELAERMQQNGEEKPSLIIFDLNNANAKPLTLIPKLKSKLKKGTSIIGFLSHVQGDLKQKAHEVGCDMVLPRSAFSQNLPQLLRRHGAPEDETPTVQ